MKILAAEHNSDAYRQAYTNFNKAIELDPSYALPYVGLFNLLTVRAVPGLPPIAPGDYSTIVRKLQKVARNLPATLQAQSQLSYNDLDFPQAEERISQALNADPKEDPGWYGFMLLNWGRTAEAREQLKLALSIEPSSAIICRLKELLDKTGFTKVMRRQKGARPR